MLVEATAIFEELHAESEGQADRMQRMLGGGHAEGAFPWSSCLFGVMFLVLLCIEAFVERIVDRYFGEETNILHNHEHSNKTADEPHSKCDHWENKCSVIEEDGAEEPPKRSQCSKDGIKYFPEIEDPSKEHHAADPTKPSEIQEAYLSPDKGTPDTDNMLQDQEERRESVRRLSHWAVAAAKRPTIVQYPPKVHGHGDDPAKSEFKADNTADTQTINPWVSILLTVVLSIHVIIEGLAIGSSTNADQIRSTFIAVVIHKVFAAFSLGSSLIVSGYWSAGNRRMFFVLVTIYVSMDVLGLGVGMGLSSTVSKSGLATAVLLSLLGGSFLFVATIELIPGELERTRSYNLNLFAVMGSLLVGFTFMAALAKFV